MTNSSSAKSKTFPVFCGSQRFVLAVKSYEKCKHFYESVALLSISESWDRAPGDRGTIYRIGDSSLELIESEIDPKCLTGVYVYFRVSNIDDYWGGMKRRTGIDIPIQNTAWGHRNFKVIDPVGMTLKIFSEINEV